LSENKKIIKKRFNLAHHATDEQTQQTGKQHLLPELDRKMHAAFHFDIRDFRFYGSSLAPVDILSAAHRKRRREPSS
jgi:hypothetical protein